DGFNLYNAIKRTPFKWLDLNRLCTTLLPGQNITMIRYFTALALDFPHNSQASTRQDIYLRALRTIPNLTVHKEGWFASRPRPMPRFPIVYPKPSEPPEMVMVQRVEEKITDVDLATNLLIDCFSDAFDEAAVISNDADLAPAIEQVRGRFGKRIGVINPHSSHKMSGYLIKAASYHYRTINKSVLAKCQFPATLADPNGTITKPPSW
ncbi:MAG: NYN domain-containing protein, partial [Dehalococcoidia bacterium]